MLGIVGEAERWIGTVISDVVNVASRVEGLTKVHGTPLLVTAATVAALGDHHGFTFRSVGELAVKGREEAVRLFTVER